MLSKNQILTSNKGRNSVANLRKTIVYNTNVDLVNDDLVLFCQFVLKILSKNQFLTSIKSRNSVANLRKTILYNTNINLVNDNVYTKFGLNLSIRSQDIEQKPNSDVNQGPLLFCKFAKNNDTKGRNSVTNLRKTIIYNTNINLVNYIVYTKFGLNRSIRFQDIEQKLNSDVNQGP